MLITYYHQQICEAVRESGQVVWAHTHHEDGLLARKDLPLRTAVGAPICSIGYVSIQFISLLFRLAAMTVGHRS